MYVGLSVSCLTRACLTATFIVFKSVGTFMKAPRKWTREHRWRASTLRTTVSTSHLPPVGVTHTDIALDCRWLSLIDRSATAGATAKNYLQKETLHITHLLHVLLAPTQELWDMNLI